MIIALGSRLSFFNDDWDILLLRPGFSAHSLFAPHNEHLIVLEVLLYKALIALFGLASQVPYRVALALALLALGAGVFVFVRERVGALLGVCAASLLLFLGPAWDDLLWSFQVGLIGSLATGVWALNLLQRDSTRRNIAACGLVIGSTSFSNLGLSFVIGAAIVVLVRWRPEQVWIPGVPAAFSAMWWIAYGHTAKSALSVTNILRLPEYVVNSAASGVASLHAAIFAANSWAVPVLFGLVTAMVVWLRRNRQTIAWIAVLGGAALSFWVLAGANLIPGREPIASRYQLVSATFVLLLTAEVIRTARLTALRIGVLAGLALVALGGNVRILTTQGYSVMHQSALYAKADLGALEIARNDVAPSFRPLSGLRRVTAERYFREIRGRGTPAYTTAEIEAAPNLMKRSADRVLVAAYRIRLAPAPAARSTAAKCVSAHVVAGSREWTTRGTALTISNRGSAPAQLSIRRFAPAAQSQPLGSLAPGAHAAMRLPRDQVTRPWQLRSSGPVSLKVCAVA